MKTTVGVLSNTAQASSHPHPFHLHAVGRRFPSLNLLSLPLLQSLVRHHASRPGSDVLFLQNARLRLGRIGDTAKKIFPRSIETTHIPNQFPNLLSSPLQQHKNWARRCVHNTSANNRVCLRFFIQHHSSTLRCTATALGAWPISPTAGTVIYSSLDGIHHSSPHPVDPFNKVHFFPSKMVLFRLSS